MARLAQIGFAQLRIEPPKGTLNDRGTRVHRMAGKDIDGAWRAFFTTHVPVLEKEGWKIDIGSDFGTRTIEPTGDVGVVVRDAGEGWFDMDIGVEIDGQRRPLLPILARLIDRGGMAATKVIDGKAQLVLDDGSVLALPAERVERLFSVLEAMLDSGRRLEEKLQVPLAEADLLIDIDDLVSRRPDETTPDRNLPAQAARRRGSAGSRRSRQLPGRIARLSADRVSRGFRALPPTTSPASWPTTWAWARRRRPWRI